MSKPLLAVALACLGLGCRASAPDESLACPVVTERWESLGQVEVASCRRLDGSTSEETGVPIHTMQLELDLKVLADTQIFAPGRLVHKSGPEGDGHRRPAGEVVTLREELVLVETEEGWVVPR